VPIFIYRDAQDEQDKNMSNICAFILSILFIPVKLSSAWPEFVRFEGLTEDERITIFLGVLVPWWLFLIL
jgi:hypothetical protein